MNKSSSNKHIWKTLLNDNEQVTLNKQVTINDQVTISE